MIGKKYALTATIAALALTMSACGGGGGPVAGDGQAMPEDVDLSNATAGFVAVAGIVQVAAGESHDHGDIAFSCAAGGSNCTVTVEVDANGAITATSTGGIVTAMNSDAYTARITPMAVDLARVTSGFMAQAGTVTVTAGQSVVLGDIEFSCAAGGNDCSVVVEVDTDGSVTAMSTGGMVTAMNSDAYTARITPMAVDLAPVTAGFMAGAGTVQVPAGQSVDHGDIAFSCAAGGADCEVIVAVGTDGTVSATSTGGMVTAMNSDAYTDRKATAHPVVGKWAGDWPGGARTVLAITSVSSDGQVTGTYRHQERGGQPFVLEISPDGPVTASIQNGVLSFSFGQSTFEFTESTEDTLSFTFQFSPDVQMVSVDVDRQDADGMMPSDVPSPDALANVIDLVANDSRQDLFGNYVGGHWWRSHDIGAQQAVVTGTYRGGQFVNAIVSHDESGQLQHNVAVFQINPLQQADPWSRAGRYINTYETPEQLEGVTNSTRSISDHGLGSKWQVTELTADYDTGGTLTIYVATDVQPSDGSVDPFETAAEVDHNIELSGAPALPADQDFLVAWIPNGDSIEGSLDGVAGTFSCANPDGCAFVDDHTPGGYYASDTGLTFTPDVGTAQPVLARSIGIVTSADYLALGHWLYVPEDVTDSVNYEFGVYASGGDPFEISHLAPLAGTATYVGDAVGKYYVDGLSDNPTVGSFTADATLTADFGDGIETGFISGEVNSFEFEDDVASSMPASVTLASRNGQLQFNVSIPGDNPLQQAGPWVRDGRYINTYQNNADLEGVTWFRRPVFDPELAGWRVEKLTNIYENASTLDIYVATDAQASDGSVDPFSGELYPDYNIHLSGAPTLEIDKDFMVAWIGDGETTEGSLSGVTGTFSCANEDGCVFIDNRYRGSYYAADPGVTFTPDGGTPQPVIPTELLSATPADYLAFGRWLYVSEDETDADAYDFGVFASGGDAFQVNNIVALTGTATYSGDAAGVYYANGLSSSPDIGTFTADVDLMADFKSSSEYGVVSGAVSNFVFDGDASSSVSSLYPTALSLTANAFDGYGVEQGSQNIFDRSWPTVSAPSRGGWISGQIEGGSADDGSYMSGYWSGMFFGNGAAPTDLPTSIGGAFSAYVWDDNQQSERGLAGSFGVHRQ